MKFANIDMSAMPSNFANKDIVTFGLGDFLQAQAVSYLYRRMGVPNKNIVILWNFELQTYTGEPVLLPINMLSAWPPLPSGGLFSSSIYPVFIGASFPEELPDKSIEWLKQWEPIGCRDAKTYSYLKSQGLSAYLSGCLTVALPQRENHSGSKVFFVDAPEDVFPYVPEALLENAEYRENMFIGDYYHSFSVKQSEFVENRYKELAREASLVVTSRLHIASPCIAMGIPVIVCVGDVASSRFSWIDKYVPIYKKADYGKIDWNPKGGLITEEQKEQILNTASEHIWWKYYQYKHLHSSKATTDFYLNRCETKTFTRKELITQIVSDILEKVPQGGGKIFRYTLWGIHYRSRWVYEAVQEQCPSAELIAVYDAYKTGDYLGHAIKHPYEIRNTCGKVFHFVCAVGACGPGKLLFNEIGLDESYYCLMEDEFRKRTSGHSIIHG